MFRKNPLLALASLACVALASLALASHEKRAMAQTVVPVHVAGGQISISAGTPAVLITATSTTRITVLAMRVAAVTAGGHIQFYNGTANPLTTGLAFLDGNGFSVYAVPSTTVNTNVFVGPETLPPLGNPGALTCSTGNSFCAQLNGASLDYEIMYVQQ